MVPVSVLLNSFHFGVGLLHFTTGNAVGAEEYRRITLARNI